MRRLAIFFLILFCLASSSAAPQESEQKPEVSVEKWTGKTIMLIGAHADDDAMSHGTLVVCH